MESWRDELYHAGVKGMTWKRHNYTAIVNGQYVYDNGTSSDRTTASGSRTNLTKTTGSSTANYVAPKPVKTEEVQQQKVTAAPEPVVETKTPVQKAKASVDTGRKFYDMQKGLPTDANVIQRAAQLGVTITDYLLGRTKKV